MKYLNSFVFLGLMIVVAGCQKKEKPQPAKKSSHSKKAVKAKKTKPTVLETKKSVAAKKNHKKADAHKKSKPAKKQHKKVVDDKKKKSEAFVSGYGF